MLLDSKGVKSKCVKRIELWSNTVTMHKHTKWTQYVDIKTIKVIIIVN